VLLFVIITDDLIQSFARLYFRENLRVLILEIFIVAKLKQQQ